MNFKIIYLLALYSIIISCSKKPNTTLNLEKHRPDIHFTPLSKWMNDPNGLVYLDGEYHLFYQHYPDSTVWGPMHWGHAVSKDMIKWEHLPIALYPDSLGWIFSGSAVIDKNNTSGLGSKENPAMVAIYTYHNEPMAKAGRNDFQYQGLAFSLDKGRTWKKYDKNPVLPNPGIKDFRDPKVAWSDTYKKWIMALSVQSQINFYSSENLLSWKLESEFGKKNGSHTGVWECPDLFPIKVKGTEELKYVLLVSVGNGAPNGGSGTQYFVGDFDGKTFKTLDNSIRWIDNGKDNYAGVTWGNIPEIDGRRLFIGWMNNWQYANDIPTDTWRGACTMPREMELLKENNQYFLVSNPVKELQNYTKNSIEIPDQKFNGDYEIKENITIPLALDIEFELQNKVQIEPFGIKLSNNNSEQTKIGYLKAKNLFYIDNTKNGWESPKKEFAKVSYAPYQTDNAKVKMKLIIDHASVELFAEDGKVVMTNQFFPTKSYDKITIFGKNVSIKNSKIMECKIN